MRLLLPALLALLVLAGVGVSNVLKMPGTSHGGTLPPLTGGEAALRDRLRHHVETLAGRIGERNVWRFDALQAAAAYLAAELRSAGFRVTEHPYTAEGRRVANLETELAGTTRPGEIVIVGAHYDSVIGSPGANDNASGCAALLEIARLLAHRRPVRTLRFVFFVNEEPPFFKSGLMGSMVYASRCRERNENVVAMYSLETIGFYSDAPGSQHYPFPLGLFYPHTGNFIGFVGDIRSRGLVRRSLHAFRSTTKFPSEGLVAPLPITGVDWSDHWSFWHAGYPAVMVTDTALFRYFHYHTERDRPHRLDYDRMARVTAGLARVAADAAGVVPESGTVGREEEP
ncbi:M28 family peptidase [Geobacter sp.]|uniref:M28 family peptidase n=1 Tax=Geobacter sp. TaxID=46610 RepID=UPI0026055414|nr:M28 family peptidase [Geobacter sp.]